jgi:hypothetical protein
MPNALSFENRGQATDDKRETKEITLKKTKGCGGKPLMNEYCFSELKQALPQMADDSCLHFSP